MFMVQVLGPLRRARPRAAAAVEPHPLITPRLSIGSGGACCARAPESLQSVCMSGVAYLQLIPTPSNPHLNVLGVSAELAP